MASIHPVAPVSHVNSGVDALPALWTSLAYVAGKEADRDALADGSITLIDLTVSGSIDGLSVVKRISGQLTVGRSTEKSSSSTPNIDHIVGAILGKLNPATREAVIRDLPAEYAAGGQCLPELSVGLAVQAENLLAALRQTKRVVSRGAIRCDYALIGVDSEASPVAGKIGC